MPIWEVFERWGIGAVALMGLAIVWWQLDASDRRFERTLADLRTERQRVLAQVLEQINDLEHAVQRIEAKPELTEEQRSWRVGVTREFDHLESRILRLEQHAMQHVPLQRHHSGH